MGMRRRSQRAILPPLDMKHRQHSRFAKYYPFAPPWREKTKERVENMDQHKSRQESARGKGRDREGSLSPKLRVDKRNSIVCFPYLYNGLLEKKKTQHRTQKEKTSPIKLNISSAHTTTTLQKEQKKQNNVKGRWCNNQFVTPPSRLETVSPFCSSRDGDGGSRRSGGPARPWRGWQCPRAALGTPLCRPPQRSTSFQ